MSAYVQHHRLTRGHAQNTAINCIAFSSDGLHLASGADDYSIIIWSVLTGRMICKIVMRSPVDVLLWHPVSAESLFVGCRNGTIYRCSNFRSVRILQFPIRLLTERRHRTPTLLRYCD